MKKRFLGLKLNSINTLNIILKLNDIFYYLVKSFNFLFIINYFKNKIDCVYNYLVDIFVCDYIYYINRFRVTYNFSSFYAKNNIFLNESLKLLDKYVSLFKLFKSSVWLEREAYDMFGIIFFNNWDLRKILTDYTFFGFPLRKDFPLSGFVEIYYDIRKKLTFEVLIELMQEFRFYIVTSLIEYWNEETNNI